MPRERELVLIPASWNADISAHAQKCYRHIIAHAHVENLKCAQTWWACSSYSGRSDATRTLDRPVDRTGTARARY